MSEQPAPVRDFSGAVTLVLDRVAESKVLQAEVAERQRPRNNTPLAVVLVVSFFAVVAWDARVMMRPPEGLPPEVARADLRQVVGSAVAHIEAFRAQEGRLPSATELAAEEVLEDGMQYAPDGMDYSLRMTDDDASVEFRSGQDVSAWVRGSVGGDQ